MMKLSTCCFNLLRSKDMQMYQTSQIIRRNTPPRDKKNNVSYVFL